MGHFFKQLTMANPILSLLAVILVLPCSAFLSFMVGVGVAVNSNQMGAMPDEYQAGYSLIDTLDMPGNQTVADFWRTVPLSQN